MVEEAKQEGLGRIVSAKGWPHWVSRAQDMAELEGLEGVPQGGKHKYFWGCMAVWKMGRRELRLPGLSVLETVGWVWDASPSPMPGSCGEGREC